MRKNLVKQLSKLLLISIFAGVLYYPSDLTTRSAEAALSVPKVIGFQGTLTDPSGSPQTGTYNFDIKLYPALTGGTSTPSFSETHGGIAVSGGFFSLPIGSINTAGFASLDFSSQYFISLDVNSTGVLSPRIPINSVGYSMRSDAAYGFVTGTSSPATPNAGNTYYDTITNKFYGYNGTSWNELGASGTGLVDGGNTLGQAVDIGSNDAQSLNLRTNNITRATIDSTGAASFANTLSVTGTTTLAGLSFTSISGQTGSFSGVVQLNQVLGLGSSTFIGSSTFANNITSTSNAYLNTAFVATSTISSLNVTGNLTALQGLYLGLGTPGTTSNAIYNNAGTLYFNGSPIGSGLGTNTFAFIVATSTTGTSSFAGGLSFANGTGTSINANSANIGDLASTAGTFGSTTTAGTSSSIGVNAVYGSFTSFTTLNLSVPTFTTGSITTSGTNASQGLAFVFGTGTSLNVINGVISALASNTINTGSSTTTGTSSAQGIASVFAQLGSLNVTGTTSTQGLSAVFGTLTSINANSADIGALSSTAGTFGSTTTTGTSSSIGINAVYGSFTSFTTLNLSTPTFTTGSITTSGTNASQGLAFVFGTGSSLNVINGVISALASNTINAGSITSTGTNSSLGIASVFAQLGSLNVTGTTSTQGLSAVFGTLTSVNANSADIGALSSTAGTFGSTTTTGTSSSIGVNAVYGSFTSFTTLNLSVPTFTTGSITTSGTNASQGLAFVFGTGSSLSANSANIGSLAVTEIRGSSGSRIIASATGQVTAVQFDITGNGSDYQFDYDFNGSADANDPTVTLVRGQTYRFNIAASGHPFRIENVNGSAYTNGLTNNGTDNGTVIFTVPFNAPDNLRYECDSHAAMIGYIRVMSQQVITDTDGNTKVEVEATNNDDIIRLTSNNTPVATFSSGSATILGTLTSSGSFATPWITLADRNANNIPWYLYESTTGGLIFDYAGLQSAKLSAAGLLTTAAGLISGGSSTIAGNLTTTGQNIFNNNLTLNPLGTGVGSTTQIKFNELSANGANYVSLRSPDNLSANYDFTLPSSYGSAGYVLQSDGSGGLGWTAPGACATCVVNGGNSFGVGTGVTLGAADAAKFSFVTSNTERMYLDSTGNFVFGSGTISNGQTFSILGTGTLVVKGLARLDNSFISSGSSTVVGTLTSSNFVTNSVTNSGTSSAQGFSGVYGTLTSANIGSLSLTVGSFGSTTTTGTSSAIGINAVYGSFTSFTTLNLSTPTFTTGSITTSGTNASQGLAFVFGTGTSLNVINGVISALASNTVNSGSITSTGTNSSLGLSSTFAQLGSLNVTGTTTTQGLSAVFGTLTSINANSADIGALSSTAGTFGSTTTTGTSSSIGVNAVYGSFTSFTTLNLSVPTLSTGSITTTGTNASQGLAFVFGTGSSLNVINGVISALASNTINTGSITSTGTNSSLGIASVFAQLGSLNVTGTTTTQGLSAVFGTLTSINANSANIGALSSTAGSFGSTTTTGTSSAIGINAVYGSFTSFTTLNLSTPTFTTGSITTSGTNASQGLAFVFGTGTSLNVINGVISALASNTINTGSSTISGTLAANSLVSSSLNSTSGQFGSITTTGTSASTGLASVFAQLGSLSVTGTTSTNGLLATYASITGANFTNQTTTGSVTTTGLSATFGTFTSANANSANIGSLSAGDINSNTITTGSLTASGTLASNGVVAANGSFTNLSATTLNLTSLSAGSSTITGTASSTGLAFVFGTGTSLNVINGVISTLTSNTINAGSSTISGTLAANSLVSSTGSFGSKVSIGTSATAYATEIGLNGLGSLRLSAPVGSDNIFTFNSRGTDVFSMRSTASNNNYLTGINGASLYLGASNGPAGSFVNQMAFTPSGSMMIGGGSISGLLNIASSTLSGTSPVLSVGTTTNGSILIALANGNIGIGTSSPYTKLAVVGTASANCFTIDGTTCLSNSSSQFISNSTGLYTIGNLAIGTSTTNSLFRVGTSPIGARFVVGNNGVFVNSDPNGYAFSGWGDAELMVGQGSLFNSVDYGIAYGTTSSAREAIIGVRNGDSTRGAGVYLGNSSTNQATTITHLGSSGSFYSTNNATEITNHVSGDINFVNYQAHQDSGIKSLTLAGNGNYAGFGVQNATHSFSVGSVTATSMNFNAFNGRLGIGTASPTSSLTVTPATGGVSPLRVTNSSGAPALLVDSSGNLSVGTSASLGYQLSIARNGSGSYLYVGNPTNTAENRVLIENGWASNLNYSLRVQRNSGDVRFTINGDGNVGVGTSTPSALLGLQGGIGVSNSHLYLSSTGNVGINTTTPTTRFDVNGNDVSTGTVFNVGSAGLTTGQLALFNISSPSLNPSNGGAILMQNLQAPSNTTAPFFRVAPNQGIATAAGLTVFNSGNVTIGTSTVDNNNLLQVQGVVVGTGGFYTNASRTNGINESGGNLSFRTNNGDGRMVISSAGNVGIGSSTPSFALGISSSSGIGIMGNTAPGVTVIPTSGSSYVFGANTAVAGAGIYDNTATAWRLLVKDTTGFIGVGTNSPDQMISLNAANAGIGIRDSATGHMGWFTRFTDRAVVASTNEVRIMGGATNNSNGSGLIVNTSGNVGIGQSTPSLKLEVEDNRSNDYVAKFTNSNNTAGAQGIVISAGANSATNSYMIRFNRPDGTEIGKIVQDSTTSVTYNTTSDARLKQEATGTVPGLAELLNINVRKYTYKDDPSAREQLGFFAQELNKIYPNAVTAGDDSVTVDKNSKIWSVDYSRLTPLLVKAVQEQQKQITALSDILTSLNEITSKLEGLEMLLGSDETLVQRLATIETRISTLEQKFTTLEEALLKAGANGQVQISNFTGGIIADLVASGSVEVLGDVEVGGHLLVSSDTAGKAVVAKGNNIVHVSFAKQYADVPDVTVSLKTPIKLDWYVVKNETINGFDIEISTAQSEDVSFTWIALGKVVIDNNKITSPNTSAVIESNTNTTSSTNTQASQEPSKTENTPNQPQEDTPNKPGNEVTETPSPTQAPENQ